MSYRPPSDEDVRRQALDPAASFLVQAPAGSGKTELLTDRILALLAIVDQPEQILAITFTRKAASEMHARVLAKLATGQGPQPQAVHERASWELARRALARDAQLGWHLLAYPARLTIRTIDAFSAWLVRGMPWLSALGGLPAITDDAETHYAKAAQACLQMVDDFPPMARLLAHLDVDLRVATELIARMLANRDQWLPVLAAHDSQALIDNLDWAIAQDLAALPQHMPRGWEADIGAALVHAANTLVAAGDERLAALCDWDGTPLGTQAEDLPQWQAVALGLLTKTGGIRGRLTKTEGFDPKSPYKPVLMDWLKAQDPDAAWVSALAAVQGLPTEGYREQQLLILQDLVQVLRLAAAQLNLCFADVAEVDFIEVAQRALRALGDEHAPTDLLLSMDAAIQHVLVDEFQDTSQSQIDLLVRLTSGWQPNDGRTLFLVGDPMQSIYRFRKAEVGWFLRVKTHGLGGVGLTPLVLTDNFRSQAGVVDWVNTVFKPLFPQQNQPALGAIAYAPSRAYHPKLPSPAVQLHPVWVTADDTPEGVAARTEEQVVALVRAALAQHGDAPKPVAILVRARNHLGQVIRSLGRQGIACRAVELAPLGQRQAVQDALQLIRALAHAGDRLAWLAVLRSPLCGLRLQTLHALFGDGDSLAVVDGLRRYFSDPERPSAIDADEAARLAQVAPVLLDAANQTGRLPFAAWVQQVWQRLGGGVVYPGADDRADVEQLFRLLETLAPYGGVDLDELERRVGRLYAASDDTGPSVDVMTIHKAKGLQFETVILMGLHRRPANDVAPLMRLEQTEGRLLLGPIAHRASDEADPVNRYLASREKQRAMYETDRLLYVAVTRARQALHLVADIALDESGQPKKPVAGSLLGRLWPHIQTPVPSPDIVSRDEALPGQTGVTPPAGRLLRRLSLSSLPAAQPRPTAPSNLDWQWQVSESDDDAVAGTVAHTWLEHLGREGLAAWPPEALHRSQGVMARQLSRAGVPPARVQAVSQIVLDTLLATVQSEKGRWLLQVAQASREWSLLDASGRVSVIDLAISDEQGWLVVDYKTGMPAPNEPIEHFAQRMKLRYAEQISGYCAQVTAMDGRPARGALYFPRPDLWVDCS